MKKDSQPPHAVDSLGVVAEAITRAEETLDLAARHLDPSLVDVLRIVATVLQPFMPESMGRMLDQLGVPGGARQLADLDIPLIDNCALPAPQGVFPRYVEPAA